MTTEELKETIRCLHEIWYCNWPGNPELSLKLHRHMEALFNFAEIEHTLVENNPDGVSPSDFKEMFGITD